MRHTSDSQEEEEKNPGEASKGKRTLTQSCHLAEDVSKPVVKKTAEKVHRAIVTDISDN